MRPHKAEYSTHAVTQWPITGSQLTDLEQQQHRGPDSSRGGHSQLLQDPPAGHHAPYAGLQDVVAVTRRLVFARSRHSTICYNEISSRLESRSAVERVGELIAATAGAPPLLLQGNPCNPSFGDPCISNRGIEMSCILLFLAKTRSTEARWSRW